MSFLYKGAGLGTAGGEVQVRSMTFEFDLRARIVSGITQIS